MKNTQSTKPTVTIGIPTYNEELNIATLLDSIISQDQEKYILEKVIVSCDASTDNTPHIVQSYAKKYSNIVLKRNTKRHGKTSRLNDIYRFNSSDYLLTVDADVVIKDPNFINILITRFIEDEKVIVIGANPQTVTPRNTFIAKALHVNYLMWEYVRMKINNGQSVYNLLGSATMLRGTFTKNFSYPSEITCDEGYLYFAAKQKGAFYFEKDAIVLFRTADTLHDFSLATARSVGERTDLVPYFGKSILADYNIPPHIKVEAVHYMLSQRPVFAIAAILLNIYCDIFSKKDVLNQQGMWEQIISTKTVITHEGKYL